MQVLVTGGAGFIGSHTVDALLKKGHEVRILDNLAKPVHLKGKPVYIPNDYPTLDGTCVRVYIHVIDLAQAHILALDNLDRHPNGKYNLGNEEGFTVLDVIETAKRVTGIDIPHEIAPKRAGDPAVLIAASDRARKELGWVPKYPDLETIVRSAWEWHRRHPTGYGVN